MDGSDSLQFVLCTFGGGDSGKMGVRMLKHAHPSPPHPPSPPPFCFLFFQCNTILVKLKHCTLCTLVLCGLQGSFGVTCTVPLKSYDVIIRCFLWPFIEAVTTSVLHPKL